jgi:hypothetical protein
MEQENENKREKAGNLKIFNRTLVALLVFFIVFSFFASVSHRLIVFRSDFLANILPRVLVDLTNIYRTSSKLGNLTVNPILEEAARRKARDMAQKAYFAHISPEGVTPWYWFEETGYDFTYAGENLAINFSDSQDVVQAWMDSPGHRDNILNKYFTEIGIAAEKGFFEGKETTFVVQLFGNPSAKMAAQNNVFAQEQNVALNAEELLSNEESEVSGASQTRDLLAIENGQNQKFLAVQNENNLPGDQAVLTGKTPIKDLSTLIERLVLSPSMILSFVYIFLGGVVLFLLILALILETRRLHHFHIAYSLGLMVLILVLYLAYLGVGDVEVLNSGLFYPLA